MPQGTGIRAVLDRAGGSDPSPFRIAFEASAPDAVVDLARRGLGVGVLSASLVVGDEGIVCVPIRGISEGGTLAIVWRTQPVNPALRIFLQLCRSAFGLDAR